MLSTTMVDSAAGVMGPAQEAGSGCRPLRPTPCRSIPTPRPGQEGFGSDCPRGPRVLAAAPLVMSLAATSGLCSNGEEIVQVLKAEEGLALSGREC